MKNIQIFVLLSSTFTMASTNLFCNPDFETYDIPSTITIVEGFRQKSFPSDPNFWYARMQPAFQLVEVTLGEIPSVGVTHAADL